MVVPLIFKRGLTPLLKMGILVIPRSTPVSRTPKADLADFHVYLKDVLGPSSTSVSAYCSMVRRVLRSVPVLNEPNLTNFFYNDLNSTMRANIRAAWNHYVSFMQTVHATALPSPGYIKVGRKERPADIYSDVAPLPSEVVDVIFKLVNVRKWPLTVLLAGTWNKVIARPPSRLGDVALIFPFAKVTHWLAFERELDVLRRWADANGAPQGATPLIPVKSGDMHPYPGLLIQQALKNLQVRPDHLDDGPRSAVGVQAPVTPVAPSAPAAPAEKKTADEIGKPVSTEELEAILRSQRMPTPDNRPTGDFFFMIDMRLPPEKKPPEGMRTRAEVEAERLRAPPRTSAMGGAIHRALDKELELIDAWERGEGIQHIGEGAEPFVFDLEED